MNEWIFIASTPVPRDLPLPLPVSEGLLKTLLVLFFLLHIFFVNLMVGGSFLSVFLEGLGFRHKKWDALAYEIAKTVTVNKSLAVVLGVGPLLCINLVYTVQWYGANALTGHAWLLIVPTIISAFLLAYLHKYTWHRWENGPLKYLHFAVGLLMALHFLFIPLIFLANVNLMLFPSEWEKVKGFFSSLQIGNVLPRYLHFLMASVALASLFLVGWFGRTRHPLGTSLPGFTRAEIMRVFYRGAAVPTMLQFLVDPLLLFTLPAVGITGQLYLIIGAGASLGMVVLWMLVKESRQGAGVVDRRYWVICFLFSLVVLGMGSGRHVYREAALAGHKEQVREKTEQYAAALAEFNQNHPLEKTGGERTGEALFASCSTCHAPNTQLVGPSLRDIANTYPGNPDGIVAWAKNPGKKRPDLPPMPSFAHMSDGDLHQIALHILEKAAGTK